MDKLRENLNSLMAEVRVSAEELSRRIGVPASTIKKIRNYCDTNPTLATLAPLAKYFSISISQLVGDENIPATRIRGSYSIEQEVLQKIPIITWLETLKWPYKSNQQYNMVATEHKYSENSYALLVEEDYWENLAQNTILLIDPLVSADHRDFVIVFKEGHKLPTLKQILFDDGDFYLKSVVQGNNISTFTSDHKLLGVVVEYKKNLKTTYI